MMVHQCRSLAAKAYVGFSCALLLGVGSVVYRDVVGYRGGGCGLRCEEVVSDVEGGLEEDVGRSGFLELGCLLAGVGACVSLFMLPDGDS